MNKICKRCEAAGIAPPWKCRSCAAVSCEHLCSYKAGAAATCEACRSSDEYLAGDNKGPFTPARGIHRFKVDLIPPNPLPDIGDLPLLLNTPQQCMQNIADATGHPGVQAMADAGMGAYIVSHDLEEVETESFSIKRVPITTLPFPDVPKDWMD